MSLKPVCVACQRFYRMKRQGYYFIEGKPRQNRAPAGTAAPDQWVPYKLWAGDLWECPDCGSQIVSGFGAAAISQDYRPDFQSQVDRLGAAQLLVKDC